MRLLGFDWIDGREQIVFRVKRIVSDPRLSHEEVGSIWTVDSRAQPSIISGTASHSVYLVWTTHGITCSVREYGRHEGFRPRLLPHLLSSD